MVMVRALALTECEKRYMSSYLSCDKATSVGIG